MVIWDVLKRGRLRAAVELPLHSAGAAPALSVGHCRRLAQPTLPAWCKMPCRDLYMAEYLFSTNRITVEVRSKVGFLQLDSNKKPGMTRKAW